MQTLSYLLREPLNQFVERLWLVSHGQCARRECILPSGTVELVVNLCDDRVQIEGTANGAPGNGGLQILLDDPSGNPIELFQPY
jgi:hypothetical protein